LPPEAPGLSTGPLTRIAQQQVAAGTTRAENKAIQILANPDAYHHADDATKQVLANPTPRLAAAASTHPLLAHNLQALNPVAVKDVLKTGLESRLAGKQAAIPITQHQAQQAGVPTDLSAPSNWFGKLGSEAAHGLVGIGPGLVNLGIAEYHHPIAATEAVGKAIGQSFARTYTHPIRNFEQDPFEFLMNTAAIPFAAAGTAARVSELARAEELAQAGGISTAGQVARTLLRPQAQVRGVTGRFGETAGEGFTLQPPAYKSALGGYAQTKLLDPLLERQMAGQTGRLTGLFGQLGQSAASTADMIGAAARFGRKARTDMQHDINIRAADLSSRMLPENAANLARGTAFADRWKSIYNAGVQETEANARGGEWSPIKAPPTNMPGDSPEFLTPKMLNAHKYLSQSDRQLAEQFVPGKGNMIAKDAFVKANPDLVRWVPKSFLDSMKPYTPGTGTAARFTNRIDKGTQIIRSGRFLTPAYFNWAIQNGLIHLSQAGPLALRNAWDLRTAFPKASKSLQAAMDAGGGKGVAQSIGFGGEATTGAGAFGGKLFGQTVGRVAPGLPGVLSKAPGFWHNLDDQWARRMGVIHELHANGYHTVNSWENLLKNNPTEFRRITRQGSRENIDYAEMTPAERASFQKMFTAYGWTRGASTYAARFALQHPIQARVGMELSREGQQKVDEFYSKLGGMAPSWLRGYYPFMGHNVIPTGMINPAETLGKVIEETPGATSAQTESLLGEFGPAPQAALGELSGMTQYGQQYKGQGWLGLPNRFIQPIEEALSKYKPLGVSEVLARSKKGGTFQQGLTAAAERFGGVPLSQLRNPTQTAGLGEKDYEQALATPDKIRFQYNQKLQNLPAELAMYQKANNGQPLDGATLSRLKSDFDAVEQRDIFQFQYANAHGAKSWKSLPPVNKLNGTLDWMSHHGYPHAEIVAFQHQAAGLTDDKQVESAVNRLWQATGIGQIESRWKSVTKGLKPPSLTKANP